MSRARVRYFGIVMTALSVSTFAACNSGPKAYHPPNINASAAGSQALDMYDKNHDGVISGEELDHVPALKSALARFDTNGDKGVSADEIAARVNTWHKMGVGVVNYSFKVTMDGTPLAGATVTFEPEPFLGDEIKKASCVTTAYGDGAATIAKEDRPDPKFPPGMHLGLYKVKISKVVNGKESIPAKYNEQTILGQEVSQDVPEIVNRSWTFALTSK